MPSKRKTAKALKPLKGTGGKKVQKATRVRPPHSAAQNTRRSNSSKANVRSGATRASKPKTRTPRR